MKGSAGVVGLCFSFRLKNKNAAFGPFNSRPGGSILQPLYLVNSSPRRLWKTVSRCWCSRTSAEFLIRVLRNLRVTASVQINADFLPDAGKMSGISRDKRQAGNLRSCICGEGNNREVKLCFTMQLDFPKFYQSQTSIRSSVSSSGNLLKHLDNATPRLAFYPSRARVAKKKIVKLARRFARGSTRQRSESQKGLALDNYEFQVNSRHSSLRGCGWLLFNAETAGRPSRRFTKHRRALLVDNESP